MRLTSAIIEWHCKSGLYASDSSSSSSALGFGPMSGSEPTLGGLKGPKGSPYTSEHDQTMDFIISRPVYKLYLDHCVMQETGLDKPLA